jgi:hypothetical protein
MLKTIGNCLHALQPYSSLCLSRPLVVFQSDDWGLLGIRDQAGFDELKARGLKLGTQPYDYYSLETAEDLYRLYEVLLRHHDSVGRSPCFVFNFILANVDFPRVIESDVRRLVLLPLDEGLPGQWQRPGLLQAYHEGIKNGLIYPAFHGFTHFSLRMAESVMQETSERGKLLRILYESDTPMVYGRTSWIDFEYRDVENGGGPTWLDAEKQRELIGEGKKIFQRMFRRAPVSACAPGYRANNDTWKAWWGEGILIGQNGPGFPMSPHFDRRGMLHLYRNVSFEPALDPCLYDERYVMNQAENAWRAGRPIIVSMHSLNLHSTLKNYRDLTLTRLDHFLTMLEDRYGDLLYVHDEDVLQIIERGGTEWNGRKATVKITKRLQVSPTLRYYIGKRAAKSTSQS